MPANISKLVYEVDLRLPPRRRWEPVLEDFVAQRGTAAFREFYSSVFASLEENAARALAFYRSHLNQFMEAYATNWPDAFGEITALADILTAHSSTPEDIQLFSREAVFLAQLHMQMASISPLPNRSAATSDANSYRMAKNGECTSVLIRRPHAIGNASSMIHFRNWDFGPAAEALGTASVTVNFIDARGGNFTCLMALTHITKWTTCVRPGGFSMSLNAREYGFGYERGREPEEELRLLTQGRLPRIEVLRRVMQARHYNEAVSAAAGADALTSLYVILADGGAPLDNSGGAVVTIMGNGSRADVWQMPDPHTKDGWFLVQTNVDHWLPMAEQYFSSHRREHVKANLRQLGSNASSDAYFHLLQNTSVFPAGNTGTDDGKTFRPSTIASVFMVPQAGAFRDVGWQTIVWKALPETVGEAIATSTEHQEPLLPIRAAMPSVLFV